MAELNAKLASLLLTYKSPRWPGQDSLDFTRRRREKTRRIPYHSGELTSVFLWRCLALPHLLDQEREFSRRKPSLLCLRLKLAKQGCFHPRDVLPKQSTASAGFRMAARPLGQRITGDPRGARVDRATTMGPLSPPSASNRVPAPVVDLGRALCRGEGVRGAARGGGAPPCRSLRPAGNLAACTR
jgi:hypothetical protein